MGIVRFAFAALATFGILISGCNGFRIKPITQLDFAGPGNYSIDDIAVSSGPDGTEDFYLTGVFFRDRDEAQCFVAKYNARHGFRWHRLTPAARGKALLLTADVKSRETSVYVVVLTAGTDRGEELRLVKYDADGTELWNRTVIDAGQEIRFTLRSDIEKNIYCVGGRRNKSNQTEIFLTKYRPDGELVWQRVHNSPGLDCPRLTFAENFYRTLTAAGMRKTTGLVFFVKFDSLGNAGQETVIDTAARDLELAGIDGDREGNTWVLAARSGPDAGASTVFRYDPQNRRSWTAACQAGTARAMALDDSLNVYVAADTGVNGQRRLTLIKYDPEGKEIWAKTDLLPAVGTGPSWFVVPEYIVSYFHNGAYASFAVVGSAEKGLVVLEFDTAGNIKHRARFPLAENRGVKVASAGGYVAVNDYEAGFITARLVRYEEFAVLGINRWD